MPSRIRSEIEQFFAMKAGCGAYKISSTGEEYPAWVVKDAFEYGVMIPYFGEDVFESFSGADLKTDIKIIQNIGAIKVLMLTCTEKLLRNEFSLICKEFVSPGESGRKRKLLLNDPIEWWKKWKALMGDSQGNKLVYDIVAELYSLVKLYQNGEKPAWNAIGLGTHDIETETASYEVKSTLNKKKTEIHISSNYQLSACKPLYIVFTRLEKSAHGKSIDDLLAEIEQHDPNKVINYNAYLEERGYVKGNHLRKEKYTILERRKIKVDDRFPKITDDMFIGGKRPDNIVHIEYDVSLEGLEYTNWK